MSFPHINNCQWVEQPKPNGLDTHKDAEFDSESAWQTFLFACDNCEMARSRCNCNGASKFVRLLMYDRSRTDGKHYNETYFNLLTANAAAAKQPTPEAPLPNTEKVNVDAVKQTIAAQLRSDSSAKIVREAKKSLQFAGLTPQEAQSFIDGVLKVSPAEQTKAETPAPQPDATAKSADEQAVTTTPTATTETQIAPEPKPKADENLFDIFTLYDEDNDEHRKHHRKVVEYNGWALLCGQLPAAENQKQEARLRTEGHYGLGVVKKGGDAGEAYWPSSNTTDAYEKEWLRRASSLKAQLDYTEALYAEWPDIQPLDGELSPVPAFDKDWLPISIQPWVVDVSERMSVPLDFAAICAICSLAGATGRRVFVYPKANDKEWKESICLSGAVVASSGKTKTPTWAAFMNPILEIEKDWEREYDKRFAEYEASMEVWNTVQKQNKEAIKVAAKTKTAPVLNPMPKPTEPMPRQRIMLNDATPEKMHDIMKQNPQGVFYYRDELSGWVAEMDMQGRESQRDLFLAAMNGNQSHDVARIGREGGHAMMCATVFGSFQPHLLIMFLSEARNIADGTVPRFHLLIWPDDLKAVKVDKKANDGAKAQYRMVARTLASLKPESVMMHFTPEAQQLFYKFMDENQAKIDHESNPGKKSHLAKYFGAIPKIAALFQLVDLVALGGNYSGNYQIDAQHFQMAWDFLSYLEAHMHRIYDSKQEGLEYRKARLAEHIQDGSLRDGLTAREIHRKDWAGLGQKVTSADSIEAALEEMVDRGWVRLIPVKPGTPGRPARRWEVNPAARK